MKRVFWRNSALALTVGLLASGCTDAGKKDGFQDYKQADKTAASGHGHDHAEHGPHGGHLIELGDHEYHGEVVFDAKDKKVTVYLLGHELDQAQPIDDKEITLNLMIDGKASPFALKAAPLEGEPAGKSSRFELAGDLTIAEHIKDEEDLKGNLSVTINGKPYSGEITHDHAHDHDHGPAKMDDGHKHDEKEPKAEKPADAKPADEKPADAK